jgi:S-adenosylmethionine synthetase
MRRDFLFTSESVTEGHPDKVCDKISDGILDAIFTQDPKSRVAVESLVTTGQVVVAGEVTTKAVINVQDVVRDVIKEIGYNDSAMGFDYRSCGVLNAIHGQSPDIAMGTNESVMGAGDQGMMFGYACNQTKELMPAPIMFAHRLSMRLTEVRKKGILPYLRPDGKSQVTVEYANGQIKRVHTVVLAAQHDEKIDMKKLQADLKKEVVDKVIPAELLDKKTVYHINATGRFEVGGPHGDTGLTGRKIIVDTYGGWASHGGGCFSGKDPTKVDRSAAYAARYVAKNIVAAGLADEVTIQLAYCIGVREPVSILVNTNETGKIADEKFEKLIRNNFDLTPAGIIKTLKLRRPIFKNTAAYGHFGRNEPDFLWEKTDKASALKKAAAKLA